MCTISPLNQLFDDNTNGLTILTVFAVVSAAGEQEFAMEENDGRRDGLVVFICIMITSFFVFVCSDV